MPFTLFQNIKRLTTNASTWLMAYQGSLYALNAVGDLYRLESGAFVLKALGNGIGNNLSNTPKLCGMDGAVYAIMGRVTPTLYALKRWTGAATYTDVNNLTGQVQGLVAQGGTLYIGSLVTSSTQLWNLYSHSGSGTTISTVYSYNTGVPDAPMKHIHSLGGNLYFIKSGEDPVGAQSGALYQWSSTPSIVAGGFTSGYRSFVASLTHNGYIFDVVDGRTPSTQVPGSSFSLRRWSGSGAWQDVAPLYETNRLLATVLFSGSAGVYAIYSRTGQNDKLLFWPEGGSEYQEIELLPTTSFSSGVEFEGNLYIIDTRGDIYMSALVSIPANASILPDSTGNISHARILRAHRSPADAQAFHEIMVGAT